MTWLQGYEERFLQPQSAEAVAERELRGLLQEDERLEAVELPSPREAELPEGQEVPGAPFEQPRVVRAAGASSLETPATRLAGDQVLPRVRGARGREDRRLVVESVGRSVRRPEAAAFGGLQRQAGGRGPELAGLVIPGLVLRHVLVLVGLPRSEDQRLQRGQALLRGAEDQRRPGAENHLAAGHVELLRQQPVSQLSVEGLGQSYRQGEVEERVHALQVPVVHRQRDRGRAEPRGPRAEEELARGPEAAAPQEAEVGPQEEAPQTEVTAKKALQPASISRAKVLVLEEETQ